MFFTTPWHWVMFCSLCENRLFIRRAGTEIIYLVHHAVSSCSLGSCCVFLFAGIMLCLPVRWDHADPHANFQINLPQIRYLLFLVHSGFWLTIGVICKEKNMLIMLQCVCMWCGIRCLLPRLPMATWVWPLGWYLVRLVGWCSRVSQLQRRKYEGVHLSLNME